MNEKATDPTAAPLYPIREVSRLTGVNSVTLRAWERRYGLIRPKRTAKGHRLYANDDIQRVERILLWLERGVPVSQVRELLDQPEIDETPVPESSDWPNQCQQLIAAVEALDMERLETLFNQSLALYPVSICLNELWQPAIAELEGHWAGQPGAELQRHVLEAFLRTRIGTRLYHANQQLRSAQLLITPLSEEHGPLGSLLLALAASQGGYRVHLLDAPLPPGDLPLAIEPLHIAAAILVSGQAERNDLIRHQLPHLAEQLSVPVCLAGAVARRHADELGDSGVELLGDDPVQAINRLESLLNR